MVPGGYARFENCSFRDVDVRQWMCTTAVELVNCTFTDHIRQAIFNGAVPEAKVKTAGRDRNEFHGNDFSGADLGDVAFRTGIDLKAQRLPKGPQYRYVEEGALVIAEICRRVTTLDDLELRKDAMALVMTLERSVADGQEQLFVNLDSLGKQFREAANLLRQLAQEVRTER